MDVALNNLKWLMCHLTKLNQTKPNQNSPSFASRNHDSAWQLLYEISNKDIDDITVI